MKTKAPLILCTILCALLLFSCGSESPYTDKIVFGMDTNITLRLANAGVDAESIDRAAEDCAYIVAKNEKIMSALVEDAHVYALNNKVDMILDPAEELCEILSIALNLADVTGGAFDPTVGALTELWNVSGGGPVPSTEAIEAALKTVGYGKVTLEDGKISTSEGVKLALGGVAKGYTVQEMLETLASSDIQYGLVSMGGNIGVFGEKEDGTLFSVGLCDPDDTASVVGYLHIADGFVAVSGDHEKYFEVDGVRYHHIMDPATGYPADSGLRSVAVWSNNGALSDGLSTALFVMGEEAALELYRSGELSFEAVMITDSHEVVLTDGLTDEKFELSAEGYTVRAADGSEPGLMG